MNDQSPRPSQNRPGEIGHHVSRVFPEENSQAKRLATPPCSLLRQSVDAPRVVHRAYGQLGADAHTPRNHGLQSPVASHDSPVAITTARRRRLLVMRSPRGTTGALERKEEPWAWRGIGGHARRRPTWGCSGEEVSMCEVCESVRGRNKSHVDQTSLSTGHRIPQTQPKGTWRFDLAL